MDPLVRLSHVAQTKSSEASMLSGRIAHLGRYIGTRRLLADADDSEFPKRLRQQPVLFLVPDGCDSCDQRT